MGIFHLRDCEGCVEFLFLLRDYERGEGRVGKCIQTSTRVTIITRIGSKLETSLNGAFGNLWIPRISGSIAL